MRRWDDLDETERTAAIEQGATFLLEAIVECGNIFDDEEIEAAIQAAVIEADRHQTPWFAGEYICDATFTAEDGKKKTIRELLYELGEQDAKEAWYPEFGEQVIYLPRDKK